MKLSSELETFVLNWAEIASRWGLNRTEALIHALLFISPRPLTAEEIATTLNVARSNVSTSLKELTSWKIIKAVNVLGDRRKHYGAAKDAWEMFRAVVAEQKRRGIDPFIILTRETKARLAQRRPRDEIEQHALSQLELMAEFFETVLGWYNQLGVMATPRIRNYLKLGGKFMKLYKGK